MQYKSNLYFFNLENVWFRKTSLHFKEQTLNITKFFSSLVVQASRSRHDTCSGTYCS
jgi:hypothetical protein